MRVRKTPKPPKIVKESKDTTPEKEIKEPTLEKFLQQNNFKKPSDFVSRNHSPIGTAMKYKFTNIVKAILNDPDFLQDLKKNPDRITQISIIARDYGFSTEVMNTISRLTHDVYDPKELVQGFCLAVSNSRSSDYEYLEKYLVYLKNNIPTKDGKYTMKDFFQESLYDSRRKVESKQYLFNVSLATVDTTLLKLFLNYGAKPDVDQVIKMIRKAEKSNHLMLWLTHDYNSNLPLVVEALKKENPDINDLPSIFYSLPKSQFDQLRLALNFTSDYEFDLDQNSEQNFEMSDELFGHIHNDRALKGTTLEGVERIITTGYLAKVLEELQQGVTDGRNTNTKANYSNNLPELIEKIKNCLSLEECANSFLQPGNIKEKGYEKKIEFMTDLVIQQLMDNDSALINGGWNNRDVGGHAMLYEIKESIPPGKKVLLIYNTGAGIDNHYKREEKKNTYYSTIKAYELDIDDFSKNKNPLATLLRKLFEILFKTRYEEKESPSYDGKKVYEEIEKITTAIGMQEVDPRRYCKEWAKGQNSGTCAWRVWTAYLKNYNYNNGMTYKDLRYEIRYKSIEEYTKQYEKNPNKKKFRQLNYAIQNFALLLSQTGNTDIDKVRRERGLELIEKARKVLSKEPFQTIKETNNKPHVPQLSETSINFTLEKTDNKIKILSPISEKKIDKKTYIAPNYVIADQSNPLESFEKAIEYCTAYLKSNQYNLATNCIEKLYLSFSLDLADKPDCLRSKDKRGYSQYSENMMYRLRHLQNIYTYAVSKQEAYIFADRSNILLCGAAIGHYILGDFSEANSYLGESVTSELTKATRNQNDLYNISCSAVINEKVNEIRKYLKEIMVGKHKTEKKAVLFSGMFSTQARYSEQEQIFIDIAKPVTRNKEFLKVIENDKSFTRDWVTKDMRTEPPKELIAIKYFYQNLYNIGHQFHSDIFELLTKYLLLDNVMEFSKAFAQNRVITEDPSKIRYVNIMEEYGFGYGLVPVLKETGYNWKLDINNEPKTVQSITAAATAEIQPQQNSPVYVEVNAEKPIGNNYIQIKNLKDIVTEKIAFQRQLLLTRIDSSTQINLTVDLMLKEFFRLKEPDMQSFCYLNLFKAGLLQKQISDTPEIASVLMNVIERGLKQNITGNNISDSGLYFFKLSCSLQKVIQEMLTEDLGSPHILEQTLTRLEEVHQKLNSMINEYANRQDPDSVDKLEKLHTYRLMMIINQVRLSNTASPEMLSDYMNDLYFRRKHVTKKNNDPFLEYNIQIDSYRCEDLLFAYLSPSTTDKFLFKVLSTTDIAIEDQTNLHWEDSHPIYLLKDRSGSTILNLNLRNGAIEQKGRIYKAIPNEVYHSELFREFLVNAPASAYYDTETSTYEFEFDKKKFLYQVPKVEQKIPPYLLKQFINGEWYTCKPDILADDLPLMIFEHNNYRWVAETKKEEIIIDRLTQEHKYLITTDSSAEKSVTQIQICDKHGKPDNYLLNPEGIQDLILADDWFARFESKEFCEISLHKIDKLVNIKFSRYGLEFQQKIIDDQLEWIWVNDPRYKLGIDATNAIPAVNAFLKLTPIDNNGEIDELIIVPKQQFYHSDVTNDEYLGLRFDTSNYVNNKLLNIKSGVMKDPHKYKVTNSEKFVTFIYSKQKGILVSQAGDYIYKAYLDLANRDAPSALLNLKQFISSGATIGLDELIWLKRIMQEIPAITDADNNDAEAFQLNAPEILAVRVLAAFTIAKNDLDNTLPDIEALLAELPNTIEENNRLKKTELLNLSTFCNDMCPNLIIAYKNYLSKLPKIAENMLLTSRQEDTLMRKIASQANNLPIQLKYRMNELSLEFLHIELDDLLKIKQTPRFTANKQKRWTTIQNQIASILRLQTFKTIPSQKEIEVIPKADFNTLNPHLANLLHQTSFKKNNYNNNMTPNEFISHFFSYASCAISGSQAEIEIIKRDNDIQLTRIANIISLRENLSLADNLRIILAYMIAYPREFSGKSLDFNSLNQYAEIAIELQIKHELIVPLISTELNYDNIGLKVTNSAIPPKPLELQKLSYELNDNSSLILFRDELKSKITLTSNDKTDLGEDLQFELAAMHFFGPQKSLALFNNLTQHLAASSALLANLKIKLINFVNRAPLNEDEKKLWELRNHSQERSSLSLERILHLFLMHDKNLFKKYTNLSDIEIKQFYEEMTEYLITATNHQQNEKLLTELTKVVQGTKADEIQKSQIEAAKLLLHERSPDIVHEPRVLLFEYLDNKRLYTTQYDFIRKMLQRNGNEQGDYVNLVLQLIMGGGKSKVLLPILSLAKANGLNISAVVVPQSLYKVYVADLRNKTQQIFNKAPFSFEFNEKVVCDKNFLLNLYHSMINVMIDREYLITTKESIQSLQLHYFKMLKSNRPEQKEERELLNSVLNLFKHHTDIIADEIHVTLDVRKELIFTLGDNEKLPKETLEFCWDMYEFFQYVPLKHAQGFNLKDVVDEKLRLTPEQYILTKPVLARAMITDANSPLAALCNELSTSQQEDLIGYLLESNKPDFIKNLPLLDQDKLSLAKQQINKILELTLSRNLNEHYGLKKVETFDSADRLPVPFLASNTPSVSEFGNYLELINYTIQVYRRALPEYILKEFVEDHLKNMQEELDLNTENDPYSNRFKKLTGWDLDKHNFKDPKVFKKFYQSVVNNKELIKFCSLNYIMNHIVRNTTTLVSTSKNFASTVNGKQGMTGTSWDHRNYPLDMIVEPGANEAIEAKVKSLLRKSTDEPLLLTSNASPLEIVPALFRNSERPEDFHSWIEVGAYSRGIHLDNFARTFVKIAETEPRMQHLQYILCFNDKDQLLAYPTQKSGLASAKPILLENFDAASIQAKLKCTPNEYFALYDQRHIVGTDIKHTANAKAFVPIGLKTMTHDLLQGVMRMRGLGNGQRVQFVIAKELQDAYPDKKWGIEEILEFCDNNRAIRLAEDSFKSTLQKMHNVIWNDCYLRILNTQTDAERTKLFEDYREIFIKFNNQTPYEQFGSISLKTKVGEALQQYKISMLNLWKDAVITPQVDQSTQIETKLDEIVADAITHCPEYIDQYPPDQTADSMVEVQLEQKSELENLKKQEKEQVLTNIKTRYPASDIALTIVDPAKIEGEVTLNNLFSEKYKSLEESISNSTALRNWKFSPNIIVSNHFLNTTSGQESILDKTRKDPALIMFEQDTITNEMKILILTPQDAAKFKNPHNVTTKMRNKNFWIESLHGVPFWGDKPTSLAPDYATAIQQIALFAGDTDILFNQYQSGSWLAVESEDKLKFLRDIVLPVHPDKINLFDRLQLKVLNPQKLASSVNEKLSIQEEKKEGIVSSHRKSNKSAFFPKRSQNLKILPVKLTVAPKEAKAEKMPELTQTKAEINQLVNDLEKVCQKTIDNISVKIFIPGNKLPLPGAFDVASIIIALCDSFKERIKTNPANYYSYYFLFTEKLLFLLNGIPKNDAFSIDLLSFANNNLLQHFSTKLGVPRLNSVEIIESIESLFSVKSSDMLDLDKRSSRTANEIALSLVRTNDPVFINDVYAFKGVVQNKLNEFKHLLYAENVNPDDPSPTPTEKGKVKNYRAKLKIAKQLRVEVDYFLQEKTSITEFRDSIDKLLIESNLIPHEGWKTSFLGGTSGTSDLIEAFQKKFPVVAPQPVIK